MKPKYTVKVTNKFKKDYKLALKRNLPVKLLEDIVQKLANAEPLPPENRDHPLSGNWANFRECHILPDWLLVYQIYNDVLVLSLARTGSHSDIF